MSAYIQPLLEALQFLANPNDAVPMKKYMKNHFEFWGIKKPELTTILKEFLKQYGLPPTEDVRSVVYSLWQQPQRECQYVGMEIYAKFALKNVPNYLDTAEMMITLRSWWDTVDFIATNIVGKHLQKYYTDAEIDELTRYWIKRDNLWLRRTALLHQLKWKKNTNEQRLFEYITICKDEKDFFIRKAIGWALREYSKTNPTAVWNFIQNTPLSPLSKKEGLKRIGIKE
jgi:3-methyladenine DNA glycosylase AlkD